MKRQKSRARIALDITHYLYVYGSTQENIDLKSVSIVIQQCHILYVQFMLAIEQSEAIIIIIEWSVMAWHDFRFSRLIKYLQQLPPRYYQQF